MQFEKGKINVVEKLPENHQMVEATWQKDPYINAYEFNTPARELLKQTKDLWKELLK
jgi:hypothetical protein